MDKDLKKIVDWLEKKRVRVFFDRRVGLGLIDIGQRAAVINPNLSIGKQVTALLHECGHLLLCRDLDKYMDKYPYRVMYATGRRSGKSYRYRLEVLEEEFDAWNRGEKLGNRLDIDLDVHNFQKHKSWFLMSYIDWISKRDWTVQVI